jgi:hypothetical protein
LLKLQALDERRAKLLSEVSTIREQMSVLKTKITQDVAVFPSVRAFYLRSQPV